MCTQTSTVRGTSWTFSRQTTSYLNQVSCSSHNKISLSQESFGSLSPPQFNTALPHPGLTQSTPTGPHNVPHSATWFSLQYEYMHHTGTTSCGWSFTPYSQRYAKSGGEGGSEVMATIWKVWPPILSPMPLGQYTEPNGECRISNTTIYMNPMPSLVNTRRCT